MIASICPGVGQDAQCGFVIIVQDSGLSLYFTGEGPYDGQDDALVGVLNLSSNAVHSLNLSSDQDIMGFDGDGLTTYVIQGGNGRKVPGNASDQTGYGGPNAYYSNINAANTAGAVNFITPIAANNGTAYFALENTLTAATTCLTGSAVK